MTGKPKQAPKELTEHEKNIEYAFHEFGAFGFNTYRFMTFFWMLDLTRAPALLADSLYSNNASWTNIKYNYARDLWSLSGPTPPLAYVGVFLIVSALSHPYFIMKILGKMTFLSYEIGRRLNDIKTMIFCIFISLLSTRMVDFAMHVVEIMFNISHRSLLIS